MMSKLSIAKRLLLAGVLTASYTAPAYAQLESALLIGKGSTEASAQSQARVASNDDDAESATREYTAVLQEIDNLRLFVDRQGVYLESQKAEIESLNEQLESVEGVKKQMVPTMLKMTYKLEDSIDSDIPFRLKERKERIAKIKKALANPNIVPAEQYRAILQAYKIEVAYGQALESYEGAHPTKAGSVVNYLRFGRTAFVYMTKDESEIGVFNRSANGGRGGWEDVGGSRAIELRQAIRIANKEAAPDIVFAPIFK